MSYRALLRGLDDITANILYGKKVKLNNSVKHSKAAMQMKFSWDYLDVVSLTPLGFYTFVVEIWKNGGD